MENEKSEITPSPLDIENARTRREIADRQRRHYDEVLLLALGAFGPGWLPSGRHFLLEKEEEERARRTGEKARPAKTVFMVRNAEGVKRHFTVEEGMVVEHVSYEAGFGDMLLEPHPTQGFEYRGQFVRIHRYSLCWACFDLYKPRTAEELAELRVSRLKKKVVRETKIWIEKNPLLAWREEEGNE